MNNSTTNQIPNRPRNRGAALLLFVLFFTFASLALASFVSGAVYNAMVQYQQLAATKQSWYASESLGEDMAYRLMNGLNYDLIEENNFYGADATTTTSIDFVSNDFVVTTDSEYYDAARTSEIRLTIGTGVAFNFGLQSGNGGIHMDNNSGVQGNVFSNGAVTGAGSADVKGDVISAGATGYSGGFYATGTVYAHTIEDMEIDGDAHYVTYIGDPDDVAGTHYSGAADQATATMPISDETIDTWKTNIETYGTIITAADAECASGTPGVYYIDSDTTLGDTKIECDLEVSKNGTTLTLTGPLWIEGNVLFDQGPTITIDPSIGMRSVQMIADNPADRTTSSQITLNNSTDFSGSGNPKSYVMLLSMNNDAEMGGGNYAIDLAQSANGDVLVYASHGLVSMGNNISLKEVTGYQIDISNGSEVIYESGLVNMLFTSGPGGGFELTGWEEI